MKIVQSPGIPEKAVSISDFSGKEFKFKTPEVQINIDFNYGSRYDGSRLSLDLFESEASEILNTIFARLHRSTRRHLESLLKKANEDYENSIDARDWSGCDQIHGRVTLYQEAIKPTPRPARPSESGKARPGLKKKAPRPKKKLRSNVTGGRDRHRGTKENP